MSVTCEYPTLIRVSTLTTVSLTSDVYFDNGMFYATTLTSCFLTPLFVVGGEILDLCLTRLNKGARIALCGAISDYNQKPKGLQGYLNLISQRAIMEGFGRWCR